MLVEFSVANFRSFLERQTLSMVGRERSGAESAHSMRSGHSSVPLLLSGAALFGPNGSGKSNFLDAMGFLDHFVYESAQGHSKRFFQVSPFKLDEVAEKSPSEFEIIFIENGNLYQYGFSVDRERVHEEWMFFTPEGGKRSQRWFERRFDRATNEYSWYINPAVKGPRETWRSATRDDALFFSTAILLNAEPFKEARGWFRKLRPWAASEAFGEEVSAEACLDESKRQEVLRFLNAADVPIADIKIQEIPIEESDFIKTVPDDLRAKLIENMKGRIDYKIRLGHKNRSGGVTYFDFNEESTGTRVLFNLSSVWKSALQNGHVIVVDELSNSLHPLVFEMIVSLFSNPEVNIGKAQLIFTSHDTHLMAPKFLDRDQIWFLEKLDGASVLTALASFKARSNEAFEKGYLGGRYGALPNIREL